VLPTSYGHTEFYSVAAQVMPILLLAIVFEQRLFRRRELPVLVTSTLSSVVIAAFVVAEAVAMRVLYRGYAHRQDQIFVIAPMLIGAALLIVPIVLPPILALDRADRTIQSRIAQAVLVASFLFVVLTLLALFKQ
jgi:hypothetical protein